MQNYRAAHSKRDLLVNAYHEAGHVVVSHYFKRKVHHAEIGEKDRNFMISSQTPSLVELAQTYIEEARESDEFWRDYVEMIRVWCAIYAAGPIAESIYTGVDIHQLRGGDDYEQIIDLCRHLSRLAEKLRGYESVDDGFKKTFFADILELPAGVLSKSGGWLYVERIVGALMMKIVLTADDLELLLTGMPQSDGHTPYTKPTVNFQYALRF